MPQPCHLHHQPHLDSEKAEAQDVIIPGLTRRGGGLRTHVETKESYGDFTLILLCLMDMMEKAPRGKTE